MTVKTTATRVETPFNIDDISSSLFAVADKEGNETTIPIGDALPLIYEVAEVSSKNTTTVKSILQQALQNVRHRLNSGLNEVLHQEELLQLEAEWTGIIQLVSDSEGAVQIQCVDTTKKIIAEDMGQNRNQRRLYQLCAPPYHRAGANPYTGVVCSFPIDGSSKQDVGTLKGMAEVAKDLHFMLMGSLSPQTIGLDSWAEMDDDTDLLELRFKSPKLAAWNSFRQTEAAQYVAMSALRHVARPTYNVNGKLAKDMDELFTESVKTIDDIPLVSPAYSMGRFFVSRLADCGLPWSMTSFNNRKDGQTFDLPLPDGRLLVQALEAEIDDRHELILSTMGINTAVHMAETDNLFYYDLCTLFEPTISTSMTEEEEHDAMRLRDFQVLAVTQRFAHCIQELERQGVGAIISLKDREDIIKGWLDHYTTGVEREAGEKPLKETTVLVDNDTAGKGRLTCKLDLYYHSFSKGTEVTVHLK